MPNVTLFIPAEKMPPEQVRQELTEQCTRLCLEGLDAALDNIHIIYVAVMQGRGHPVFAEIRYRLAPSRTPSVMQVFMEKLDQLIHSNTGLIARIRCFGYAATDIHARN